MSKNKKIILAGLLLAMQIVLARFLSIKTPIVTIGFSFVPAILCAIWLGPKWCILISILADLIGATLFPFGSFFIGYTITTAVASAIYGILLYKKEENCYTDKQFILRMILAVLLVTLLANIGLNTLWLSITTGKAFLVLLASRLLKELIMVPIKIILMIFLERVLRTPFHKYLRGEND
ncbi:MAG: folate family ECF transporter S component [Clostridia bacterium]|nr:folate family ECF transporter S component [Clostridia bacterium]